MTRFPGSSCLRRRVRLLGVMAQVALCLPGTAAAQSSTPTPPPTAPEPERADPTAGEEAGRISSPPPEAPSAPAPRRYTRGQTVGLSLLSGVFSAGGFSVNRIPSARVFGVHNYYGYVTEIAADVPLVAISPIDGLGVGGVQVGAIGSTLSLRYGADHDAAVKPYYVVVDNISAHIALWATYATYRTMRLRGSSDAWTDEWHPATAGELLVAPFKVSNLNHPIVYIPLLALTGIELTSGIIAHDSETVHAGPALRDSANGLALSFSAGVTEEALFRGVLYEELKLSMGRWPARIVDSTAFSLWHVPGELGTEDTATILEGLATRAALSMLLEAAYDQGGLPESVALHTLWDVSVFTFAAVTGKPAFGGDAAPARTPRATDRGAPVLFPIASGAF